MQVTLRNCRCMKAMACACMADMCRSCMINLRTISWQHCQPAPPFVFINQNKMKTKRVDSVHEPTTNRTNSNSPEDEAGTSWKNLSLLCLQQSCAASLKFWYRVFCFVFADGFKGDFLDVFFIFLKKFAEGKCFKRLMDQNRTTDRQDIFYEAP